MQVAIRNTILPTIGETNCQLAMDGNSWRAPQGQMAPGPPQGGQVGGGGEVSAAPNATPPATIDSGDWRTQLQADSRQRIVNKIMETLKRHLPFSGQEGLQELEKIAVRFEEKIYTAATSQSDYLRKISLKMLTMETKSQNPMANPLQANTVNTGEIFIDCGMENGNGVLGADGQGVNGHEEPVRPIRYRLRGSGARLRYTPRRGVPRCACRTKYTYPNAVVLSLDDERQELVDANRSLREELDGLGDVLTFHNARIRTLEAQVEALEALVENERDRGRAARDQVQRFRARLTRVVDHVQDWTARILADTNVLIDEVAEVNANALLEEPLGEDSSEEPFEFEPVEEDISEEIEPVEEDLSEEAPSGSPAEE